MANPTLASVIAAARFTVQDEDAEAYRNDDARMLRLVNDYLHQMRRDAPDLFLGSLAAPLADRAAGDDFPLGWAYVDRAAFYVVSRLDMVESEYAVNGRVAAAATIATRR